MFSLNKFTLGNIIIGLSQQRKYFESQKKSCNKVKKNCIHINCRNQDSEVEDPVDSNGDLQIASPGSSEAQQALLTFWPKISEEIKKITNVSFPVTVITK